MPLLLAPPFPRRARRACRAALALLVRPALLGALAAAAAPFAAPLAAQPRPAPPLPAEVGETVRFVHGGDTLVGSLFVPPGPGPHPAVVMLEGSGGLSYRRDWVADDAYPMWRLLTDAMRARGLAVLLYEKPGVGRSTGDWRRQSFEDRADEALAAVAWLRAHPAIDAGRVGLVGHSQGGYVAPVAAVRGGEAVAFVVSLAGPGVPVWRQVEDDMTIGWRCERRTGVSRTLRHGALHAGLFGLRQVARVARPGYLSRIVRHDPEPWLRRLEQPTLALFAGHDRLVPAEENAAIWRRQAPAAADDARVVLTVPGATHGFQTGPLCPDPAAPGEPTLAPGALEALGHEGFWRRALGAAAPAG